MARPIVPPKKKTTTTAAPTPPTSMSSCSSPSRPPRPLALSLGPERGVYLHSSDPSDHPGMRFVHSSVDGRVRIEIDDDDDDDDSGGVGRRYGGIVEGDVRDGDVVREIAGIDARRPISEHMWKLTRGLMRVAPRPIEVIVASERDEEEEEDDDDEKGKDEESTMMMDGGGGGGAAYYQLDLTGAAVHHGGPTAADDDDVVVDVDVVRRNNPFDDVGRFGPERRVVFLRESLGVKLHRSPEEGIVRVLSVTKAVVVAIDEEKSRREGPDDDDIDDDDIDDDDDGSSTGRRGRVEPGDVILEVGGVDLRNKVIGVLEWADMVHFVRNVGRPLEMVVARDGNFVPSPATMTTTIGMDVDDARREEEVEVEDEGGGIFDNACFSLRADEICNLPCPGTGGVVLCGVKIPPPSPIQLHPPAAAKGGDGGPAASSPSSSPASNKKAHPWDRYAQGEGRDDEDDDDNDNDSVYAASVVAIGASAPSVVPDGMIATTKTADDDVEGCGGLAPPVVAPAASWPARVVRANGGTTRPTGSPAPADDSQHGRSAYVPLFPRTHPKIISSRPPSQQQPKQEGDVRPAAGSDKLTVAQLRAKFSPIRNPGTPAAPRPGPVRVAEEDAAKLRGLFSPMVVPESSADVAYRPDDPPESRESASPVVVPEGSESTMMSDGDALDVRPDPVKMSPSHKREELARTIVKGKRGGGDARKIQDDWPTNPQVPDPVPSPTRPFDEPSSESRDDTHHRHGKIPPETNNCAAKPLLAKSGKRNHLPSGWAHEQGPNRDLSPTGSTVSVENDKTPSKTKSFGEGPFRAPDGDADSPFVGDIKFATPNQRVPSSALFSQAFLVQPNPAGEGPVNVRWVQTNSPLFVTRKTNDSVSSRTRPPDSDDLILDPNAKTFNASAFDLPQLDWNEGEKSLADADQDPSSELNETIVYADSMEAARVDCCSISDLLDGFAQNCGINSNSSWQAKETANNVPSPRRKNILSKIRNKKKKNLEYGNLVDDDMKGVRKARVQLAYQNIRGKTTAKASQFALLVDDEICF